MAKGNMLRTPSVAQQHTLPTAVVRRELLSYTKTAVTRNQGEKKINSLLDHVSTSSNMRLLQVCSNDHSAAMAIASL